jgi:hypothetical protein
MSKLSFVVFVLATLGTLVPTGCKKQAPKSIVQISKPDHWVQLSAQTPEGGIVSLSVPDDWGDMTGSGPLIARRASTTTNDFRSNVSVTVGLFDGGLEGYVSANKRALTQQAELVSEGRVLLGQRDGYELVYSLSGPPRSAAIQILQMAGREGIVVTCSVPAGDAEAMRDVCDKIFGTFSITEAAP